MDKYIYSIGALNEAQVKGGIFKPYFYKKGWGHEIWIVNKPEYCSKVLHFEKDKKCSFHFHKEKDETFHLLKGKLKIILSDNPQKIEEKTTLILNQGESLYIPHYRVHQIIALEESDLLETSTQHFDEDSY